MLAGGERTPRPASWSIVEQGNRAVKIWQPAIAQAMQRHGGRTRPLVPASANPVGTKPVVTPSHDDARDEGRPDDKAENPTSAAPDSKE
jgi:hypothetical protein